ncbi:hypothetical protein KW95_04425 [Clostridioides difficile]|nr:hypothetical protein KW95_04425 [Clostridioides difficile]
MRIEEIAKKYAKSMPGYELVKYCECACPVYKMDLNITMQKKKELGIVQEFCLKFLSNEIKEIEEISKFLGLDKNIIYDNIVELNRLDLVKVNSENDVLITPKGRNVLAELNLLVPEELNIQIYADGLTKNIFMSNVKFYNVKEAKKFNLRILKPYKTRDELKDIKKNAVSRIIKKYNKEHAKDDKYDGNILSINSINKSYLEYKKLNILVFCSIDREEMDIKVFEKGDRVPEYEEIILKMQNNSIKQIDLDENIIFEDVNEQNSFTQKLPKDIIDNALEHEKNREKVEEEVGKIEAEIKESENILSEDFIDSEEKYRLVERIRALEKEISTLKNKLNSEQRVVHTYEHRELLVKTLKNAKEFVIVVSPWIKKSGLDSEIENLIKQAIGRKVSVYIGYGISDKEDSDKEIIYRLNKIKEKNSRLKITRLANTHEKVLVCDRDFMVVTSFNWLSFKGNPKWGFRQELGIYTEHQEVIKSIILNLEERMDMSIS